MKRIALGICLAAAIALLLAGCTADLGKVPTVEAEEFENEGTTEEEGPEHAESSAVLDEEPGGEEWADLPVFEEDLPEKIQEDSSDTESSEEDEEGVWVDEVNSPEGRAYTFFPTYVYDTVSSGRVMSDEPLVDDMSELVEPLDAEITYGEAVDIAAGVETLFMGKAPEAGWGVQYYPGETTKAELYLDGRSEFHVWQHDGNTSFSYINIDSITGEWTEINYSSKALPGDQIFEKLQNAKEKGLDTAELEEYVEQARRFTEAKEPLNIAVYTAKTLGFTVESAEQEKSKVLLSADGDPAYADFMREKAKQGELDPWEYNKGVVKVTVTTNKEKIEFEIDTFNQAMKILRGAHLSDESQWIEIEAE